MSIRQRFATAAVVALAGALLGAPVAAQVSAPIPAASLGVKLNPGYNHPRSVETDNPAARQARSDALRAGTVRTLPTWRLTFTVAGKDYAANLVGAIPGVSGATTIDTVIVPVRVAVPDVSADGGKTRVVFDGNQATASVLGSPIFELSTYSSGDLTFVDAMLHAEFPMAPASWSTLYAPRVGHQISLVAPPHAVKVYAAKSGQLLGVVMDDKLIDAALVKALGAYPATTHVIFVTYNLLEHDAFGYHGFIDVKSRDGTTGNRNLAVFTYTSWLVGVDDLFTIPSPDATTLAHEIAEVTHDPLITSLTREWGDAFGGNRCFQPYIEVGDAIEDAPAAVQLWTQPVTLNGVTTSYTLQNEALLPWFERQTPSTAAGGAYSFPSPTALTKAAPLNCVK